MGESGSWHDRATGFAVSAVWIVTILMACGSGPTAPGSGGGGGGDGTDDGGDPPPPTGTLPAFPGAEGFGAFALGGRGGQVIPVTNLDDAGPGSLRAALEAPGPRIVVFRVGGTIDLNTPLIIDEPFVTIAGQSAPGDGIAIRNSGSVGRQLLQIRTHDVVIRHLRSRPGPDTSAEGSCCLDAISISGTDAHDVILDHVSLSWAVDENAEIFAGARDITIQWSILAEGLACSNHEKSIVPGGTGPCPTGGNPHSRGMTISAAPGGIAPDNISLHHNLFAHNTVRHPNISSATFVDLVNNVMYDFETAGSNLGLKTEGGVVRLNYVANYLKPGPSTLAAGSPWMMELDDGVGGLDAFEIFIDGNTVESPIREGWPGWLSTDADARVEARHAAPAITETSAAQALELVLAGAGATAPARDEVDERLVAQVRDGTGGIIDHPSQVGGWPDLQSGEAPADSDGDGMPDTWELEHGFDPTDPTDGPADRDGDGYTNVEEFLNGTDPDA